MVYVYVFSVDLPFVDDMALISWITAARQGTLNWIQLAGQHNEHRILVPRVVMLLMALVSGYDLRWEVAASYVALCASLWVLYRLYRIAAQDRPRHPLAFLPVSLLFVGWRQHEGLLWGFHLASTLALFFSLTTIYFLHRGLRRDTFPYAAAATGALASFSSGFGLGVWLLGFLFLAAVRSEENPIPRRKRLAWLAFWCVCAAATLTAYFTGYHIHPAPWPTGFAYLGANVGAAMGYILAATGAPLTWGFRAAAAGGLGTLGALAVLAATVPLKTLRSAQTLPVVLVTGLPLLGLPGLLLRRLGLGMDQALSSRYVTLTNLLPLGIYILVVTIRDGGVLLRMVRVAFIALLCLGIFQSYFMGIKYGTGQFQARSNCRPVLRRYATEPDEALICAFPDGAQTRIFAGELERNHLSLFRPGEHD